MTGALFDMATATEQTAFARLCADDFHQLGVGVDVEGRAFLVVNVMAGTALEPVATIEQQSFNAGIRAVVKNSAVRDEDGFRCVMEKPIRGGQSRVIRE